MNRKEVADYIVANYQSKTDEEMAAQLNVTVDTVRGKRRRMGLDKPRSVGQAPLDQIRALLQKSGIPLEEIDRVEKVRVGTYQMLTKNNDGEAEIHDLDVASLVLAPIPTWAEGPKWPVIQPATPATIKPLAASPIRRLVGWGKAVVLPDPQIGFGQDLANGGLYPFHDEGAMAIAMRVLRDIQPEVIVNVGDFMDFAQFGKHRQEPSFQLTTQPTIDRAYQFLAEQRANAPDAKIVLLEGNHDLRLQTYIKDNAMAAFGLRRAEAPEKWPVLSVPSLLRLDELDVEYVVGYPRNEFWINQNLKVIHGWESKSRGFGATSRSVVEQARESVIQGHCHRLEEAQKTVWDHGVEKLYTAIAAGCLCRTDGFVPAMGSGYDLMGKPIPSHQNWQQGFVVVDYKRGNGDFRPELVRILKKNGKRWALYRDAMYEA